MDNVITSGTIVAITTNNGFSLELKFELKPVLFGLCKRTEFSLDDIWTNNGVKALSDSTV